MRVCVVDYSDGKTDIEVFATLRAARERVNALGYTELESKSPCIEAWERPDGDFAYLMPRRVRGRARVR